MMLYLGKEVPQRLKAEVYTGYTAGPEGLLHPSLGYGKEKNGLT